MFFIVSKLLFFLIQPLVWVTTLLLLSLTTKSLIRRKNYLIATLTLLFVFSNQFLFNEVSLAWEDQIKTTIKKQDRFAAVVIMGGISSYDKARGQHSFYANSERLVNVLPLYFKGKVDKILFAGGSGKLSDDQVEAESIREYLLSIGVRSEDIIVETKSRNTAENANYSTQLLAENQIKGPILLSTSATHMYRSVACFQKLGQEVVPFPVDYVSTRNKSYTLDYLLLPDPRMLNFWYWLLHEWLGIISYKMMGYC